MKTRVKSFSSILISLTFCLGLASCNKEDFYEKEFLDNPFQSPTAEEPVDDGSHGGETSGTEGGTQGGVDSGVDGGTTGGTTGSSTSGSEGGVDGGDNGGVDGGTVGGSTGGTPGETDGGSNGGDNGGVTGGGLPGDTTGGSTGGYGDCSKGDLEKDTLCKVENFRQTAEQTKKLDIVWIIDNSGSMADEQAALGSNFSAFINEFITKDVDFKMAITTTDTNRDNKGKMVTGSDVKLTSQKARDNETQFKKDFNSLVKVGTSGSGSEKGLEASEGFMDRYASTFLRSDAYLAVVVLSDEEDQSSKSVKHYTDYLKSFKSEEGLVKIYTIADIKNTNKGSGIKTGALRYIEASNQTAGVVSDIRNDFHMTLAEMGDTLINLLDSFALGATPVDGTLKVYVNGDLTTDYTFDSASRSIKFNPNNLPPVGSEISVYYIQQ
jgi:hypothetical protein